MHTSVCKLSYVGEGGGGAFSSFDYEVEPACDHVDVGIHILSQINVQL